MVLKSTLKMIGLKLRSENTRLISAPARAGECLVEAHGDVSGVRRVPAVLATGPLEPSVAAHCQVGSSGRGRAQQECGGLISFRGARDPRKEKQTSAQKTRRGSVRAVFFLLGLRCGWQI